MYIYKARVYIYRERCIFRRFPRREEGLRAPVPLCRPGLQLREEAGRTIHIYIYIYICIYTRALYIYIYIHTHNII